MPETVVLTGAGGPVGRRVAQLLRRDPAVARVIAVAADDEVVPVDVEPARLPVDDDEAKRLLDGADALVLLGPATAADDLDGTGRSGVDLATTRRLLGAATSVRTVVVLSSALVYGAWPNNPVPLTEDAALRPDPDLPYAVALGQVEALAAEWRREHPGAGVAVLRPAIAVAGDRAEWLARSPWSPSGVRVRQAEAPLQFVHLDDVAAAVDLARRRQLDGAYNVAPDGWLTPEALTALAGPTPRVALPPALAERWLAWRRHGATPTASVVAAVSHPWVIANDRLRAEGWEPSHTSEEAFVAADEVGAWRGMNPGTRQQLSLAVAGAVVVVVVVGAGLALRRARQRAAALLDDVTG